MMKYLKNFHKSINLIFCGICFFTLTFSNAEALSVKEDGSNELVLAFHRPDPITTLLVVVGVYGTATPVETVLTDPLTEHSFNPILAASRDVSVTTNAVVVWQSYLLASADFSVELSLNASGTWSAPVVFYDVDEAPSNDYVVDISADGTTISVAWTTYIISANETKVRLEQTVDDGANWTTTYFDVF